MHGCPLGVHSQEACGLACLAKGPLCPSNLQAKTKASVESRVQTITAILGTRAADTVLGDMRPLTGTDGKLPAFSSGPHAGKSFTPKELLWAWWRNINRSVCEHKQQEGQPEGATEALAQHVPDGACKRASKRQKPSQPQ